jgi:hypothetical protein
MAKQKRAPPFGSARRVQCLRGYFVEPPFIESWFIIACGAAVGFMALPFIELPFIAAWAIFGAGVAFMAACIALCAIAEGAGELWASAEPVSAPHMSATESMVRIERILGSDQEVSDPAGERSEGCIAKRKRRVTSSARRRLSKK